MSEEEIIKETNEWLKYDSNFINLPEYDAKNLYKVVQGLLDLYQKEKQTSHFLQSELDQANAKLIEEKQKNKELENADLTTVYINGFYDGEKKWKDKINEKIADYTEKVKMPLVNSQSIREYTFGIRAFQRLLEERN